ncbi:uncharacterized protein N7469_000784 [Penicillium citrinum]|jgi:hypothetical protein|uniref:DUF7707 domain-containing protein n=2 Tax=Penicillium TaxID=5073 RepID=A0A9W9PEQ3_PENCI|nr:uncharacterized protein N7469_000784 [Penicillium citrinum]KAJ5242457.1 hypothetical protein N7469_000784 [Penicillium citrinum]KAJ5600044.1 hypothetical protein N7450_001111 [Penicillium hetheringtonii]
MRSSIVLMSAFATMALGQNSTGTTYTLPQGFNIGQVKPDELNSWCTGQRNVCPEICSTGTKQNTCDPKTLQFSCVCSDDKTPDVSQYVQTVPFYVCQANFAQCIQNHPDDADGQKECKEAAQCGSKNASSISTTTTASSSASATTTLAMTTSTDESTSETSSSVAAAATTSNAAIAMGESYSSGVMVGAMFLAARMFL